MGSPVGFRVPHQGLGVDARLNLSSIVQYHPSELSHSESTAVLNEVAESSTHRSRSPSPSSQPETSP